MEVNKNYLLQLNLKGVLKTWKRPLIMGVLNITHDSFYKGSRILSLEQALDTAGRMIDEGADILDLGAQSTRPSSEPVSPEKELTRLLPIINIITKHFPKMVLSVDTYYSDVADKCLEAGVHIVNDISAGDLDKKIMGVTAKKKAPFIAMHMQGTPKTMQQKPYYQDVCKEVTEYLQAKCKQAEDAGIHDIILDFGFGFGKTIEHNYELLRNINAIKNVLQKPILVGVSRKSMLWRLLNSSPEEVLPATSALHLFALQQGADILRVHDVKEAHQVRILWSEWLNNVPLRCNLDIY